MSSASEDRARPAPRYTAAGAALHALLTEVVRTPPDTPGLARGRRALLRALAARPSATVAELVRDPAVPPATRQGVQRLVDGLVAAGLVARLPNPRHRRAPRLALTPAGRRRAAAVVCEEAERLNALARDLDPQALRAAARLLRDLRARLAEPAGEARPPSPPPSAGRA